MFGSVNIIETKADVWAFLLVIIEPQTKPGVNQHIF